MRKTYLAGCQNLRQEAASLYQSTVSKFHFPLNQDQWLIGATHRMLREIAEMLGFAELITGAL